MAIKQPYRKLEMAYSRGGPASRTVALDLMLRTFMNSADFHVSNPRIWENIAKLVPGTTPQQCAQRWEELRASSSTVVGDYSGLTAQGRPISGRSVHKRQMTKFVRSMLNMHSHPTRPPSECGAYPSVGDRDPYRPQSVLSNASMSMDRPKSVAETHRPGSMGHQSGKFVANFCQNVLTGGGGKDEKEEEEEKEEGREERNTNGSHHGSGCQESGLSPEEKSVPENQPNMIIHVCDEAKKLKRDFSCPRDTLVREMHYFAEYLSSDAQLWDEVDISVHCDVPVFDWLMRYAKRGMMEGPCGEELTEPLEAPKLEASTAVSILISSDFLKMKGLVEECLDFCHDHISEVVASPCNMGCINERLTSRLVERFTPMEIENIVDKKDKIKSKLFAHQLALLFKPGYTSSFSPASAATLYRCRHCVRLLTAEQHAFLPCTMQRLSLDRSGRVVYSHERDLAWDVNRFLLSLQQQEGLTARDIYWRIWGVVNWLVCDCCKTPFQCSDLSRCAYHPRPAAPISSSSTTSATALEYLCCRQPARKFSLLPYQQNGCTYRDHVVECHSKPPSSTSSSTSSSSSSSTDDKGQVYSILLTVREAVCRKISRTDSGTKLEDNWDVCLLQNEERKPPTFPSQEPQYPNRTDKDSSQQPSEVASPAPPHPAFSASTGKRLSAQAVSMATRQQSVGDGEEEEDEPDRQPLPASHQPKQNRRSTRHGGHSQGAPLRHRHSRNDLQGPVEWIWDSRKSKRWNQDMQRDSDERRLASLTVQLSQSLPSKTPPTEGPVPSSASRNNQMGYAGGIFSRLEAQFRAKQTAKALAMQGGQARAQGLGRRR